MTAIGLILLLLASPPAAPEVTLQYLGHSCFVLTGSGGHRLVFDPYASGEWPGLEFPYTHADVVVVSHPHWDHDAWRQIRGNPKVIEETGEFREKEFRIRTLEGRHAPVGGDNIGFVNRVIVVETDGLRFCHLGDNGPPDADGSLAEAIGPIDALMLPVDSEHRVLTDDQADEWIAALSPRLVIPMHYKIPGVSLQSIEGIGTVDEWLWRHPGFEPAPEGRVTWPAARPAEERSGPERTRVLVMMLPGQEPPVGPGAAGRTEAGHIKQQGQEALAGGDEATALQRFLEAARLDPDDADLLMKIGFLYLGSGRPDRALGFLEDAVGAAGSEDPESASLSWLGRGMSLDLLGRRDEAIEAYGKVVEIGVNDQQQVDQARVYLERPYESM